MSREPVMDLDDTIEAMAFEARALFKRWKATTAAVEHLRALRDGQYLSAADRIEIRDLERAFSNAHRQDRHRKPPRPF